MLEPICYVYVKGSQPLLVLVNISIFHPLVPTTAFMIYWAPGSCQRLLSWSIDPPARAKDCFHDLLGPPFGPKIALLICWAPRSCQRLLSWFVGHPIRAKECFHDLLGPLFVPKIKTIGNHEAPRTLAYCCMAPVPCCLFPTMACHSLLVLRIKMDFRTTTMRGNTDETHTQSCWYISSGYQGLRSSQPASCKGIGTQRNGL